MLSPNTHGRIYDETLFQIGNAIVNTTDIDTGIPAR